MGLFPACVLEGSTGLLKKILLNGRKREEAEEELGRKKLINIHKWEGKMRNEVFYLRLREKILLFFFFILMLVAGYFY